MFEGKYEEIEVDLYIGAICIFLMPEISLGIKVRILRIKGDDGEWMIETNNVNLTVELPH